MTKKELQELINFLVSELKILREGYNKLSDDASNDRLSKNKFYEMWRKADEKAEQYGGLLVAIHEIIQAHYTGDDVDYDAIRKLIDDWYVEFDDADDQTGGTERKQRV